MALSPAGKVRTLLDLPMAITLHDVATDGRVLIALNSMRLALGFGTVGSQSDVDLILAQLERRERYRTRRKVRAV